MESPKDFFISFNHEDRAWAEWIAWTLADKGYTMLSHEKRVSPFIDKRQYTERQTCRGVPGTRLLTLDYTPGCSVWRGANVMQIGIVAKRIGLSVDAIRFYERNGLLPRPPRTEGGFRRYAESDLETLAFVRRVRGLGFKLSEIRGLLKLRGDRFQPCAPVQRRLQEKLSDIQRKLSDLHKLEHELRLALRSCNRELRKRDAHCPILRKSESIGDWRAKGES